MKKYLFYSLLLSLCLGFSACGGDDDDDDNKKKPEDEHPEFVWGGDYNNPTDPKYVGQGKTYNPLAGIWWSYGKPREKTYGYWFDKSLNFHLERPGDFSELQGYFEINDKAFSYKPKHGEGVYTFIREYIGPYTVGNETRMKIRRVLFNSNYSRWEYEEWEECVKIGDN